MKRFLKLVKLELGSDLMRTVLISGATGGIGIAIAQKFLENGYYAVLLYHANMSRKEALEKD